MWLQSPRWLIPKVAQPQRAKAEEEALRQAQEHMRFVAQLEEQRKVDEENAKRDKIIAKAQKLAEEEDPDILEVFSKVRTSSTHPIDNDLTPG